jgi:MATE family multidrug resistance protein
VIGSYEGAGDSKSSAEVTKSSYFVCGILTLFCTIFGICGYFVLPYLDQPAAVLDLASPYYLIVILSFIPYFIFTQFKQIGEGFGNTVYAMKAAITGNVLNVIFNYIFIFGKLGIPAMGLNGAGVGTLLSRLVMPVMMYASFSKIESLAQVVRAHPDVKLSFDKAREIVSIGFPIAGQILLEVSLFSGAAIMMGWIGEVPLAAHLIALSFCSFTFLVITGFGMAATIRISNLSGAGSKEDLWKVTVASITSGLFFMAIAAVSFYFFRFELAAIFSSDEAVIAQTASLFVVAACFQLIDGLQGVCIGVLRGLSDVKMPMIIAGVSFLGIGLPVSYLCAFTFGYGADGIWYGFIVGIAIASVAYCQRIYSSISRRA